MSTFLLSSGLRPDATTYREPDHKILGDQLEKAHMFQGTGFSSCISRTCN